MRPTIARLAAACALAVTFTGTAVAGNPNAPGQQKKDDAAAAQPAQQDQQQATQASATNPSGQSNGQATAPGQVRKSEQVPAPAPAEQAAPRQQAQASSQPSHAAPGQMKTQASSGSSSSSSSSSAQAGVKPSSTTTHWTHCRTGGSAGAATCTAQAGTPNVGADVSKRYGNGTTAAQIAVSRGASAGTLITGPGNSQPHKVSDCRHKSNPSGGVDVHAVKSYSTSCATETQQVPSTPQVSVTHLCGQDIVTTLSQSVIGVLHGHSEHLMTNTHSAHFTKHADKLVFGQTASTQVVPSTETCGSSSNSGSSTSTSNSSSNTSTSSNTNTNTSSSTSSNTSNASSNTTSNTSNTSSTSTSNTSNASSGTQSANGVLGAEKTPAKPKAGSSGGVLGTVSNVAGTSLPFTGFPLWIAALVGLGLVASGALFWRRGAARV